MKTLKICLAWHNLNSSNYGVSALAIAHLNLIVQVAKENNINLQIDTLGFPAAKGLGIREELESRLNLSIAQNTIGLKRLLKDLCTFKLGQTFAQNKYDYVFDIGEGDSFADIYGLKRFFFMVVTKYFAVRHGVKLVLAPQTIGPFKSPFLAKIAKYFMNKSERIYVRDHKSHEYLSSIGIDSAEVSDVAFILPFDPMPTINDSVGVNVSALLWHGGYTQNNQFNLGVDYQKMVIEMISQFIKRGKSVYLISHVITDTMEVEDDYRVSQQVKDQFFAGDNSVCVAPKFKSPIEAKSYISQMKFFVGSRMHATIGALSSGVPTVPLAYSRKFSGVFGSINYPYTIDIYGQQNHDSVLAELFDNYDNQYDLIASQGKKSIIVAKQRLDTYSGFLKGLLK